VKKSLNAFIVILLSFIGFNSIANAFDFNIQNNSISSMDRTGNDNHNSKNGVTQEK
jgi:hypothetical protein